MSDRENSAAEAWLWQAIGLEPAWVRAFRDVARNQAPQLALLHAAVLTDHYRGAGLALSAPAWRAPWPAPRAIPLDIREALTCAVLGQEGLHSALGERAKRLAADHVIYNRPGPARTHMRLFRPPKISLSYDGSIAAAITLAHEVGHGVQMMDGAGFSRRSPPMAAAEVVSQVAERAAAVHLAARRPQAVEAQCRDDLLAMLVRHPARDAYEQAGQSPTAWPAIALGFAPSHDWRQTPSEPTSGAQPTRGALLCYGLAAALALVVWDSLQGAHRLRPDYAAWVLSGPSAHVRGLAALLPADLADPSLYEHAYRLALAMMRHPPSPRAPE